MQRPVDITKHLDAIGPVGSMRRLQEIARLDLGKRSEAAKKVIKARLKRMGMNYRVGKRVYNAIVKQP